MGKGKINIIIAENSLIIRNGIETVLKDIDQHDISTIVVPHSDMLLDSISIHKPDILIINTSFINDISEIKDKYRIPCVALQINLTDKNILSRYDASISIFDDETTINRTISSLLRFNTDSDSKEPVSSREKEIIIGVVKGLTNKEIAEQLFISVHTVITHRRNIARKLEIHSPAGLTIYAIVNKLVDVNDIKMI